MNNRGGNAPIDGRRRLGCKTDQLMGRHAIRNSGNEERRPIESLADAAVASGQGSGGFDFAVVNAVSSRRRYGDWISGRGNRTSAGYDAPARIRAAGSAGYQGRGLPGPESLPVGFNGEGGC